MKIKRIIVLIGVIFGLIGSVSGISLLNQPKNLTSASNNQNIITVYDDKKIIFSTDAKTVGEALSKAKIIIHKYDLVEPSLDTKIEDGFFINIFRSSPLTIVDGDQNLTVHTPYKVVDKILKQVNKNFYNEDKAILAANNLRSASDIGLKMVIKRAKKINLKLFGTDNIVRTQKNKVADFLLEKNIKLADDERISHSLEDKITDDMNLQIWREGSQNVTKKEEIVFSIRKNYNFDQDPGYKKIIEVGTPGEKIVEYQVEIINNQEVSRKKINETILKQPQEQVEEIGVKGIYNSPSENENITWNYLIKQGFTRNQTAGIMGNLMQEHRFSTSDVPGGLGIVQWTQGRRQNLINQYPDSYLSIYSQLDFMMKELNANGLTSQIKNTETIHQSLVIFQNKFERCGHCREDLRIKYAADILASH